MQTEVNLSALIREVEIDRVEQHLAGRVICSLCGATLATYATRCTVDVAVRCEGFERIEAARRDRTA